MFDYGMAAPWRTARILDGESDMADQARILIAGAGIGGLALAHALRRGGLQVAVYERDEAPAVRNQGYRIHVDADGNAALRACLPPHVLDLVRRTSGVTNDLLAAYTHELQQVMAQIFPASADQITHVDRNAFRNGMLTGLNDSVTFGRTVSGYRATAAGRVEVYFADGGSDEGDLLVGADGIASVVRRQLLPGAVLEDLGLRCIYGRMPITEATGALLPPDFDRGFCWVADPRGCGAGFAPMRFRTRPEGAADYLMTSLVARPARLGLSDDELFALGAPDLWKITSEATADWHPSLREIFAQAVPGSFFPVTIRAARRIEPWRPGPVTLLGDAVHTMPPTGGIGASTALQDAATLADALLSAVRAQTSLVDAVSAYERVMLPRGFANIEQSVRNADLMFAG